MDIPTEIKIEYDVLKNSMDAKYQYENVYSNTKDKTDDDVFNDWFDEVSNRNWLYWYKTITDKAENLLKNASLLVKRILEVFLQQNK